MTPTALLLLLLQSFGWTAPDLEPACSNFYNDIIAGNDSFDNLTRVRTDSGFVQVTESDPYLFEWIMQGDTVTGFQPTFNDYEWNCEGMFYIEIRVTHIPTGTIYSKSVATWGNWGSLNLPQCDEGLCLLCVDPIWTDFAPYEFATSPEWDLNGDWTANTADLLLVLEW